MPKFTIRLPGPSNIRCPYCNLVTRSEHGLTQHINRIHIDDYVETITRDHEKVPVNWDIYNNDYPDVDNGTPQEDLDSQYIHTPTHENCNDLIKLVRDELGTTPEVTNYLALYELDASPFRSIEVFILARWAFGLFPRLSESRFAELIRILTHPLFRYRNSPANLTKKNACDKIMRSKHYIGKVLDASYFVILYYTGLEIVSW